MATKKQKKATPLLEALPTATYARVSTQMQADGGYSLDDQRAKLTAYCNAMGWPIVAEYVEVASGTNTDRPQLTAMMEAAERGDVKRIVVTALDRLARNVADFLQMVDELNRLNVALVLIKESLDTGTPTGRFVATLFAALAEFERTTILDRLQAGKRAKAQQGGFNGSPIPFGYAYDGLHFTVVDDQAETVRRIFTRYAEGQTMMAIAAALNAEGVPTRRGGRWYQSTIGAILGNVFYTGQIEYQDCLTQGTHPPIISMAAYSIVKGMRR